MHANTAPLMVLESSWSTAFSSVATDPWGLRGRGGRKRKC